MAHTCLYLTLQHSSIALLGSTWLYNTLPWVCFVVREGTTLYYGTTCFCLTVLHSAVALLDSKTVYLGSSWLYLTLPWLYLVLLDSTAIYHGSTCMTLPWIHMAVLYFTTLYHDSTGPASSNPLWIIHKHCVTEHFDLCLVSRTRGSLRESLAPRA